MYPSFEVTTRVVMAQGTKLNLVYFISKILKHLFLNCKWWCEFTTILFYEQLSIQAQQPYQNIKFFWKLPKKLGLISNFKGHQRPKLLHDLRTWPWILAVNYDGSRRLQHEVIPSWFAFYKKLDEPIISI